MGTRYWLMTRMRLRAGVGGVDEHDVAQGAVVEAEVDEAFFLDELGLLQDAVVERAMCSVSRRLNLRR